MKEIIKKYLSEIYPLRHPKIDAIIEDEDMDNCKHFSSSSTKTFIEKIKESKKLSSAPDEMERLFDQEESEASKRIL